TTFTTIPVRRTPCLTRRRASPTATRPSDRSFTYPPSGEVLELGGIGRSIHSGGDTQDFTASRRIPSPVEPL
ncbi:hypothetical protein BDZ89DRAFT_1059004, partial [Hymenopellis radicata]